MLRFNSLTIKNIGPFKDEQTIDFTSENGVTFIWGNNGRGKTTLLNIFRYALYGRFQNRRGATVDYTTLTNRESRIEGEYGFKVILRMTYDNTEYELTRQFQARTGIKHPTKNDDYESYMFLKKGTAMLSKEEAEHILKSIMPEQVSRFFLFDGELLQEYEELLIDEAEASRKIKTSIEEILGVPVLTNGAIDTDLVLEEYKKLKNKAAQRNQQTQQTASQIEMLNAQLQEHYYEFNRLHELLTEEKTKKSRLEGDLQENEHINKLISDIKVIDNILFEKNLTKESLLSEITTISKDVWKWLVSSRVSIMLDEIKKDLNELENKEHDQKITQRFIADMESAADNKHCSICDQDIGDEHIVQLVQRIKIAKNDYGKLTPEEVSVLRELRERCAALEPMKYPNSKEKLELLERQLDETIVAISDNKRRLNALNEELQKFGETSELTARMQTKAQELSQSISKIKNYEDGKAAEQDKITNTKNTLQTLNAKLDSMAMGVEMDEAKKRVELCEQIHSVFEEGIAAYRDKLKTDVERDATELFLKISSDPDYIKLSINDNYGLSIVHVSGEAVPLRSAGFEHIVALSLIGALHKNAPLRGPIIMDSPFGRLDPIHKSKITSALPHMSEQIVLLAYTSEIDEQEARATLGVALKREYALVRQNSFHTRIELQHN